MAKRISAQCLEKVALRPRFLPSEQLVTNQGAGRVNRITGQSVGSESVRRRKRAITASDCVGCEPANWWRACTSLPRSKCVVVLYMIEVRARDILTRLYRKTLILLATCLHGVQFA